MIRQWRRDLFPAEKRVGFKQLEEYFDTAEIALVDELTVPLNQMIDRLMKEVERIVKEKDYSALKSLKIGYKDKMVNIVRQRLFDAYTMGKQQVYREFSKVREPSISTQIRDYFNAKAEAVISDLLEKVRTQTIFTVLAGVKAAKSLDQILFAVKGPAYKHEPERQPA